MHCLVTAGPTFEPIDEVRRITNFSTGALGTRLAGFLAARGWRVTLLRGQVAVHTERPDGVEIVEFTTGENLATELEHRRTTPVQAVFHAAAVGDFAVNRALRHPPRGTLAPVDPGKRPVPGKLDSRGGPWFLELVATPKIIARLREWFPHAFLVGWKYEVDGERAGAIAEARQQCRDCGTDVCVANGPAYGPGFGLVRRTDEPVHLAEARDLFAELARQADAFCQREPAGPP